MMISSVGEQEEKFLLPFQRNLCEQGQLLQKKAIPKDTIPERFQLFLLSKGVLLLSTRVRFVHYFRSFVHSFRPCVRTLSTLLDRGIFRFPCRADIRRFLCRKHARFLKIFQFPSKFRQKSLKAAVTALRRQRLLLCLGRLRLLLR